MPVEMTWDQRRFLEIRARLKAAGHGGLTRELSKSLKVAGEQIRVAEQTAARQLPAHGVKHTGLRESIAEATAVRVSGSNTNPGVTVYVKRSAGRLGRATNLAKGWRHPVYGNRNTWVRQVMSPGWWGRAARPLLPKAQEEVRQALDRVAAKIAKG